MLQSLGSFIGILLIESSLREQLLNYLTSITDRILMSMVRKHLRDDEDGLSIIGVVIASLIIMLALIPAAALLESTLAVSADNQHRVVAANLATQQMENIRNDIATQTFTTWLQGTGLTTSTSSAKLAPLAQTVGLITYTVNTALSWSPGNFQSGGCSAVTATAGQAPPLLEVAIKVTWPNERLATPVTLVSSINAPSSLFSTTFGSALISVIGAGGASDPQAGVLVDLFAGSVTGTPLTGTTDDTGCVFFPNLAAGTYTAEVSQTQLDSTVIFNAGYLSQASTPTITQSLTVAPAQTAGYQFIYDKGTSLSVADPTQAAIGSGFGLVAADAYLYNNTTAKALELNGSGSPAVFGPVFPNSSGYASWLGACSQYVPSSTYQTQIATAPGGSTSISGLQYSTLSATLQDATGSSLPAGTAVDIYVWQYSSASATASCNASPVVIPAVTNSLSQVSVNVPMGYFALAAGYPTDTTAPSAPTTSIIDATTPSSSTGSPIVVTPAITVS